MKKRNNNRKQTAQMLTLITQLGFVMIASVGMTTALGIWLDKVFGTSFITVILFFLGAMGGIQAAYGLVNQFFNDGKAADAGRPEDDGTKKE